MMEFSPAMRCDLVRAVRVILVRHFIDLGRVYYTVSPRGLYLAGILDRLPGSMNPLTPQIVEAIFRDLAGIPRVGLITADLENWKQPAGTGGAWVLVQRQKTRSSADERVKTYEIGKDDLLPQRRA